jgi:hypothetical protein
LKAAFSEQGIWVKLTEDLRMGYRKVTGDAMKVKDRMLGEKEIWSRSKCFFKTKV